jgi:hypothetical protein
LERAACPSKHEKKKPIAHPTQGKSQCWLPLQKIAEAFAYTALSITEGNSWTLRNSISSPCVIQRTARYRRCSSPTPSSISCDEDMLSLKIITTVIIFLLFIY